jgi:DNA polymerase-3 subunit gamma/tau
VKFVFATTEVHKVPITILSRCQRYDFKMIAAQTIAARLRYVLGEEKIQADDGAVSLLAREAAGSMRDAMSLLDQAIAWGGEHLVGEEVARVLGVASRTTLHRLTEALVDGDATSCLHVVAELVENGHDLAHVARDLLAMMRDLVVARVVAEPGPLLDLADEERAGVIALAARTSADDLVRLHQGFSRSYDEVARSATPRGSLEMALVRLARRPPLVPLDDLVGKLGDLERRLAGGAPPPPQRGGPIGRQSAPSGGSGGGGGGGAMPPPPARPAPARSSSSGGGPMAMSRTNLATAISPELAAFVQPPPPRPSAPPSSRPSAAPQKIARPLVVHDPSVPLPAPRANVDMAAWTRVVDRLARDKAPLASLLELAAPLEVSAERVVLGFAPDTFEAGQASDPRHVEVVLSAVRAELAAETSVSIELTAEAPQLLTLARVRAAEAWERREAARARVIEHPMVKAAMELLDAELVDVRLGDASRLPPAQRSGK